MAKVDRPACIHQSRPANQRARAYVRFTPKSGQRADMRECPLCAKSGHSHRQQKSPLFDHLVSEGEDESGMVNPIALAVLRLRTSSNFVTCSTGKSAGLVLPPM